MRIKKVLKNTKRKVSKRSSNLGKRPQKKRDHLASFPELNPNPVVEVNADGSIEYLNPAAKKLFPHLREMGHQHEWLVDLEAIVALLKDQKKAYYVRELKVYGNWYHQSFHLTPGIDHIRIYGLDITERKRAEQEHERLRVEAENERRRLEAVMEALPVGVALTDAQGGNVRSNRAYEQVWGSPRPPAASVADYAPRIRPGGPKQVYPLPRRNGPPPRLWRKVKLSSGSCWRFSDSTVPGRLSSIAALQFSMRTARLPDARWPSRISPICGRPSKRCVKAS